MSEFYPPIPEVDPFLSERRFTIGRAFELTWDSVKRNYGVLLGVVVIIILINVALTIIVTALDAIAAPVGSCSNLLFSIFVGWPLNAGLLYFSVMICRGERPGVGGLFVGFTRYWPIMGIMVLITLIVIACMIPLFIGVILAAILGQNSSVMAAAILITAGVVTLVLVIGFGLRLFMAPIFHLDPYQGHPGVIESLSRSWQTTRPIAGRLLIFLILLSLITLLSLLLLIVGIIFLGYPMMFAGYGAAYCLATGTTNTAVPPMYAEPTFQPPDGSAQYI